MELKLKHNFLLILFWLLQTTYANEPFYFCGYYIENDATYYNLFDQENISQKAFYPFLRTDDAAFYNSITPEDSENIALWHAYFKKKYTKKVLTEIIYNDGKKDYLARFKNGTKENKAIAYLKFAKDCEAIAVNRNYSWDYNEILKAKNTNTVKLLSTGLSLFENSNDQALKMRYAYQIIRLYHYGKEYHEGISFFENQIASLQLKNEIYYYALDQLAGCYYKTKQYEKAAYTFLTVFEKSFDRKASAFTSYKFCTYKGAEGKTLLKTAEEEANQIFISGLRNFSDSLQDLQKIVAMGVAEDKQELLFMRILNNLERTILNTYFKNEETSMFTIDEKTSYTLNELLDFVGQKVENEPKNKDFWKLADSYLSFLNGNTAEAKYKLASVNVSTFKNQKEQLSIVYNVFSWNEITIENEEWLAAVFSKNKNIQVVDYCSFKSNEVAGQPCNLHSFVFKQLSHYYYKNNQLAKAFLLHNYMNNIHGISSHALVDDLIRLVEKQDKNSFEKLLLRDETEKGISTKTIIKDLHKAKGNIYFRKGDVANALPYFRNTKQDAFMPADVFSNHTMECFSCDAFNVMEDEVYKHKEFSFLQHKMSKENLLVNLQRLENLIANEQEKPWKRKLANYLLANYFFNVSNTGYYRSLMYSGFRYSYDFDFGRSNQRMENFIADKNAYYFTPIYNSYNGLAKKAKKYYKKTIALSSNDELNARCAYMIAKCELNDYYNNGWEYDYGFYDGSEFDRFTNEGFEALKTKYNHTGFYTEIKSKCSFFRSYDAH